MASSKRAQRRRNKRNTKRRTRLRNQIDEMKRKVLEIKLDPDSTKWDLDRAKVIQRLFPKY